MSVGKNIERTSTWGNVERLSLNLSISPPLLAHGISSKLWSAIYYHFFPEKRNFCKLCLNIRFTVKTWFFKFRLIIDIYHNFVLKTKGLPFEFYQNLIFFHHLFIKSNWVNEKIQFFLLFLHFLSVSFAQFLLKKHVLNNI